MKRNSGIIGPRQEVELTAPDLCKVSDLYDQYTHKLEKKWPENIVLSTNTVSATTIQEGGSVTFTVKSDYHEVGFIYWTIDTTGGTNSADFSASSGSAALSGVNTDIVITTLINDPAEGNETFFLNYRQGSVSGPIIATSPTVTITNFTLPVADGPIPKTTQTPGINWVNGNLGLSANYMFAQYGSYCNDGDTVRLIFAFRSGNSFRSDLQLDDLFVNTNSVTSGGTNLNIDSTTSSNGPEQSTTRNQYSATTFPDAAAITTFYNSTTFFDVSNGTTTGQWNIDSFGTGSSGTGLTVVGSGAYCYWEATSSSAGYPYRMRLLRTREFTISKPSGTYGFRVRVGAYGSNMGLLRVFVIK